MKVTMFVALVVAAGLLVAGNGYAQSAKAMAMVSDTTLLNWTTGPTTPGSWTTLPSSTIKTANQKSLFIDVALQCGLYTQTLVRSKGGNKDTSTAESTIEVRVLVDGVPAAPGPVVFANRMQQLSATLEGVIAGCLTIVDGNVVLDPDCVTPEEIELIQETLSANSFNFVADVGSGDHPVLVQARVRSTTDVDEGTALARGKVGMGGVTVEEVRMVKDMEWDF